mmetsp:Transcript_27181/g.47455  ORF Transcript_27181/g.47455 Transcript_27181/m.47455 type:complete len:359 (+) Transcript_27181:167-1243(+)
MDQIARNIVDKELAPVLELLKTVVTNLHNHPGDPRYRRLPYSTNRKLRAMLDSSTDGQAFLMALGYSMDKTGDLNLDLKGRTVDAVRPLYARALSILVQSLDQLSPQETALDRSLPSQPEEGAAGSSSVTVRFVKGGPKLHGTVIARRFDASDTLQHVMTWTEGSMELTRRGDRRDDQAAAATDQPESQYQLVDRAQRNRAFTAEDANSTLQSLGLWPIANLTAVVRDPSSADSSAPDGAGSRPVVDTRAQRRSERPLPSQLLKAHRDRHQAFSSKRAMGSTQAVKRAQASAAAERRMAQDRLLATLMAESKATEASDPSAAAAEADQQAQLERDEALALQLAREFEKEFSQMQEAQA